MIGTVRCVMLVLGVALAGCSQPTGIRQTEYDIEGKPVGEKAGASWTLGRQQKPTAPPPEPWRPMPEENFRPGQ